MSAKAIRSCRRFKGEVFLPGDKSIAHRALILSALAPSRTKIENFPPNKDCHFTLKAFQKLGIKIRSEKNNRLTVYGRGLTGLKKPPGPIFVGDSGTTLRLLSGVLAACDFETKLIAGNSLSRRPMLRITGPLRKMGADIYGRRQRAEEFPPITIRGKGLRGISFRMPVASAQVKSAIMLAALYALGPTRIIERLKSRDHTERILKLFRADIKIKGHTITVKGGRELLSPGEIYVPGDISSASFFMVAAVILPQAEVRIGKVSLNPSRDGVIKVLKRMGADIQIQKAIPRLRSGQAEKRQNFEPMGDILVKSSSLKGTTVRKEEIPSLIDELPILMVAASLTRGKTIFEGAQELRFKETDRIRSMCENLRKMGAHIRVKVEKKGREIIEILGVEELKGAKVKSFGDHRTAMSMVVAGLAAGGITRIDDLSCISKSFPGFLRQLKRLIL